MTKNYLRKTRFLSHKERTILLLQLPSIGLYATRAYYDFEIGFFYRCFEFLIASDSRNVEEIIFNKAKFSN